MAGAVWTSGYLIPTETVSMVLDLFTDGLVAVAISQNLVSFEGGGMRLVSKLVDQNFPAIGRIISDTLAAGTEAGTATVEVRGLMDGLRRVQIAAEAKRDAGIITKEVRLSCETRHVVVSTPPAGTEAATAEDSVEACITGDFGTIAANGVLLQRALESAPGETACITIMAGNMPLMVLKCPSPEHSGFASYLTLHRI